MRQNQSLILCSAWVEVESINQSLILLGMRQNRSHTVSYVEAEPLTHDIEAESPILVLFMEAASLGGGGGPPEVATSNLKGIDVRVLY